MAIHHKIRQIREEKGIKQQSIADFLNIAQGSYAKIENGQQQIKADVLKQIADFLGAEIEDFYKGECNNVQINGANQSINQGIKSQVFHQQDIDKIQQLYEKLLVSKEAELLAAYKIIELNNKRMQELETALQKYNL